MKLSEFLSENFQFLDVKFSIYLNRRVFVMIMASPPAWTSSAGIFSTHRKCFDCCFPLQKQPIQIYREFHLQKLKSFR